MFITGYVDGVQDSEVFGWAVDTRQPDQAVKLQIYVDEEPLTDVLAIEHRADIAKLFGTDGLNGFRVSVPSSFLRSPVVTISIRSEAGTHLGNSRSEEH